MTLFQKLLLFAFFTTVVVVSSILAVANARKTRDSIRVADMAVLQNLLEVGYHRSARYPATGLADGQYATLGSSNFGKLCLTPQSQVVFSVYSTPCSGSNLLERIPRDPQWTSGGAGTPCTNDPTSACEYTYAVTPDGSTYQIRFRLEGPTSTLTCSRYPCIKAVTKDGIQ